jgi:hypothetical protein
VVASVRTALVTPVVKVRSSPDVYDTVWLLLLLITMVSVEVRQRRRSPKSYMIRWQLAKAFETCLLPPLSLELERVYH